MHKRLKAMGQSKYSQDFLKGAVPHADTLEIPMTWKKPRTVFVNSMSDLFHVNVPFDFILQVFQVMKNTPQHTYLILTKRPERAVEFWSWMKFNLHGWRCSENVWMGPSCNDQASAEERIPDLLLLDGCLHFLSYEPATGPVDLSRLECKDWRVNVLAGYAVHSRGPLSEIFSVKLDWVIAGGESGSKAEPSNPDWFRRVRDHCVRTSVPYFFKQYGLWHPANTVTMEPGRKYQVKRYPVNQMVHRNNREAMVKMNDKSFNLLDGKVWQQFPEPKKATS